MGRITLLLVADFDHRPTKADILNAYAHDALPQIAETLVNYGLVEIKETGEKDHAYLAVSSLYTDVPPMNVDLEKEDDK